MNRSLKPIMIISAGIHFAIFGTALADQILSQGYDWTGPYIGAQLGGLAGLADFKNPLGKSIFGDDVNTPGFSAGGQVGYRWQLPNSQWVIGGQADANWMSANGTNTCFAVSGIFVSATCSATPQAIGTFTANGGLVVDSKGQMLVYVKGGAAWLRESLSATTNGDISGSNFSKSVDTAAVGWTAGAGLEEAISQRLTVFLEYNYLNGGRFSIGLPEGFRQATPGPDALRAFPTTPTSSSVNQNFHMIKLGVNYKLDSDLFRLSSAVDDGTLPGPDLQGSETWVHGWEFSFEPRVWFSSGKFQWNIGPRPGNTNSDVSRLSYRDLSGLSGEYAQRIETPSNVFAKGYFGLGSINSGSINDEDWLLQSPGNTIPYSNTISDIENGSIQYVTADFGYDIMSEEQQKLGLFVGYNYLHEQWDSYGCTQIADARGPCTPQISNNTIVGTENSTWNSLRVGANAQTSLADRVWLSADLAYLPYAQVTGRDNHLARATTTFFDQEGTGRGVQLETIISYAVSKEFSLGLGGRYWAMWTRSGTDHCTGCDGVEVVSPPRSAKFSTARYGVFLQGSFKLDVD
jgi:opacity protein-like surface antigen